MLVARSTQLFFLEGGGVLLFDNERLYYNIINFSCLRLRINSMPKVNGGHVEIKTT